MAERDILKFLQSLGLSKREIQVYMFLAKSGAQATSLAAKRLKIERVQAYRTFKKLQEKGFIEATLERPTRFTIIPLEKLLESFIEAKRGEVEDLDLQKESLLSSWRTVSMPESEYAIAKFSVISGKKKIHYKMLSMIEEAKTTVYVLTTSIGAIQEDMGGVFDTIIETSAKNNKIKFKIMANISVENLDLIELLVKRFSENRSIFCRHLNLKTRFFPRFLIKDEEEALLHVSGGEEPSVLSIEDEGLWINDKMFISILKAFFVQMWQTSIDAQERIEELRTGIPIGETIIIKDSEAALNKIAQVLDTAKEDVVLITSSQSLNGILENDPIAKHRKQGVKYRIMAPVDLDNLGAAKKLSALYEIKHVPINYMTILLIDEKNLFMFKSPPLADRSNSPLYLAETFYTNDPRSSKRVSEMLNDIWRRGTDLSEITRQAGIKLPSLTVLINDPLSKIVDTILKENRKSLLIIDKDQPIGLINDRDLLSEIVENKKNPEKTLAKDLNYTPIITIDNKKSIIDAIKTMRGKGVKRVAVVKGGQLVGIVTPD